MLTFLSDEWIQALHDAAVGDAALATCTEGVSITIEQQITGGPEGDVTFHLVLDHGEITVAPGPAPSATVRFHQDYATAASIAMGQGSAQRAFMTGRLRVGGDLRVLLDHNEVLTQVGDVFAAVRERTDPPIVDPAPASASSAAAADEIPA